ncbi:MAG: DUF6297 family protein [Propionibacteriaceae bacterium]
MSKKTRRRTGPQPGAATTSVPELAPEPVQPVAAPEPESLPPLRDLIDVEPLAVSEAALRTMMRDWRHGRATRHWWDMIQDGYVALLAAVMIGAMLVSLVIRAQGAVSGCDTEGCLSARTLLPWAALCGVLALTLMIARVFGPVVASAAEGFWLMEAPIRRASILWGRLVSVIVGAMVASAIFGGLVAALTGSTWAGVLNWGVAAALGSGGLLSVAAAEQTRDRTWVTRTLQWLTGIVGLAALLVVIATAANWLPPIGWLAYAGLRLDLVVSAVGAVLLVGAGTLALLRLDEIRRARLVSGGSLVAGMQGAMYAMDMSLMRDILVERDAISRGHVRPTKGYGTGVTALIWRDAQRLVRFPKQGILLVLSIVVPYAVSALGLGVLSPVVSGLVLLTALVPLLGMLRVLTRTGGLARSFPFTTPQLRTAAMTVPAVATLVWIAAVTPAFAGLGTGTVRLTWIDAAIHATVTGLAGLLGAVRWVTAKAPNYNQPMVQMGGFGAMPPGMMGNLIKGIDIVALVTLPILFGWTYWISVVIAGIAFFVLRGSFSTDSMREAQEEQQRTVAAAKAEGKKKIPPPKR